MSGGSFHYAYQNADDDIEVFKSLSDYRDIEAYLRAESRHDAADEVQKFILACETAQRRLMVMGARIAPILRAAEWSASFDSNIEGVDMAFAKLDMTAQEA